MWEWIQQLSSGGGSFLGALAGSFLGLIAILLGALYNARLNRQRDDTIRVEEARAVAQAIRAELVTIKAALTHNIEAMEGDERDGGGYLGPDITHLIQIFPSVLPQIGLIPQDQIKSVIEAYAVTRQITENLLMIGGRLEEGPPERQLVFIPKELGKRGPRCTKASLDT